MSEEFDRVWNLAIRAAVEAVHRAPVFPRKDSGGPIADGERIIIMDRCGKQVESLLRGKK